MDPPDSKSVHTDGWNSTPARIFQFAVNFSTKNPVTASEWVNSLPPGEAKSWAQKNLIRNWKQYDPKAAELWEKSLPATERGTFEKLEMK